METSIIEVPPVIQEIAAEPDFHDRVDQLEAVMARYPEFLLDIPPVHRLAGGVYMREVTIPAGTLISGKIHKEQHFCHISQGECTVWSEQTGTLRISGPYTFVSEPGARRVIFAHTDTTWATFHHTTKDMVEDIEEDIYEKRAVTVTDTSIGEEIFKRLLVHVIEANNLLGESE